MSRVANGSGAGGAAYRPAPRSVTRLNQPRQQPPVNGGGRGRPAPPSDPMMKKPVFNGRGGSHQTAPARPAVSKTTVDFIF